MITKSQIEETQSKWGNCVVEIGALKNNKEAYTASTDTMLHQLYAFDVGEVLFKPTKAADQQFRLNFDGAKSYFIGGNPNYSEDLGFALQPWILVKFVNEAISLNENHAIAMGNYFFTNSDGQEIKVEYTFGYIQDKNGNLKINLHHSSLPYNYDK